MFVYHNVIVRGAINRPQGCRLCLCFTQILDEPYGRLGDTGHGVVKGRVLRRTLVKGGLVSGGGHDGRQAARQSGRQACAPPLDLRTFLKTNLN